MYVARLNLGRLGGHPFELAALGANADRTERSWRRRMPEVLKEVHAGTCVLNQHAAASVLLGQRDCLAPQLGIFEPATETWSK